ncbi:MAG TPA: TrbG/VirB9 family P-type conjugative transfer protein [Alphaproteobacteria bacterium]|nr:TrbG/VirB9 family P-type conjugative transfer protein [Alphaproteobacteria bacterium]
MTPRHASLIGWAALPLLAACTLTAEPPPQRPAPAAPPRVYTMADLRIPETVVEPAGPRQPPAPRPTTAQMRAWVGQAAEAALELPTLRCFNGKACEYWYHPDQQYLVYMAVMRQTLVCLKPGELILDVVTPGAEVWIPHTPYAYGSGPDRTECVAFMPRRAGLDHEVAIFTDQRKYDLRVETWTETHHVEVRWRYPEDILAALNSPGRGAAGERMPNPAPNRAYRDRFCGYDLEGGTPPWRPEATADGQPPVCDDGEVTVIQFRPGTLGGFGAPAVWRIDENGARLPVQFGRMNATYRVAGVHEHLLLGAGDDEVHIRRWRR